MTPLTDEHIATLLSAVRELDPESIALCLLFSYLNPEHEQRLNDALRAAGFAVSPSHQILPTRGEYERGMATWLNAWLAPRVADYLQRLQQATAPAPLAIMQSHGGTIASQQAADLAVNLLLSGPAGGLAAAQRLGQQLQQPQLMTFDMGGTSTDVALLDGDIRLTQQGHIGPYPVAVPMVDMHTIGAGGGSLAYVDDAGLLHVGPQSAGADPGPACYGKGGRQVTVTDANVVLGRLQPDFALGGSLALDVPAAEQAMDRLAQALGLTRQQAADGVLALANEHMTQALRVISIQKGFDPADFALRLWWRLRPACLRAGRQPGHDPGHCAGRRPVCRRAGLRPRKREMLQALPAQVDEPLLHERIAQLQQQGQTNSLPKASAQANSPPGVCGHVLPGQSSVLQIDWGHLADRETRFHTAHQQRFGHQLGLPVEQVNLRVQSQAQNNPPAQPDCHTRSASANALSPCPAQTPRWPCITANHWAPGSVSPVLPDLRGRGHLAGRRLACHRRFPGAPVAATEGMATVPIRQSANTFGTLIGRKVEFDPFSVLCPSSRVGHNSGSVFLLLDIYAELSE